ncbi:RDD family protein [Ancylomarina euxinus]|uniref:RDD family protein n=2 Tax=Ancylomarina euxinus TaxID=2283627 RepID=A0A425Y2H7_9BACT|nr:hypothetical protein [Ancylomarina euxinus]RRG22172.1 RDD family protein [Ancylomarina euxinus]
MITILAKVKNIIRMENIRVETSQNVQISYKVASVGERIVASLLDGLFLFVLYMVLAFIVGSTGGPSPILYVFFIIPMFYSLLFETFMDGQSPGKKVMKIKVSRIDGGAPRFSHYFVRWLFRLVDMLLTSYICAILTVVIGGKGQRLGDLLAETCVIRIGKKIQLENTILEKLPEDYELSFPEASRLTEKDLRLIRKVITQLASLDDPIEKVQFGLRARKRVMEQLDIVTQMKPDLFFVCLLRDYNYLYRTKKL